MYEIAFVNEQRGFNFQSYDQVRGFMQRVYGAAYIDEKQIVYCEFFPKLLGYYERRSSDKVFEMMKFNNDIYGINDPSAWLYRTIVVDDHWIDAHSAFGLSIVACTCYSQKGFLTSVVVQKLERGWCIHVFVDRVNRNTGEMIDQDPVDLTNAVKNWYAYRNAEVISYS